MLGACNLKINKMKFLYTKYYIRNTLVLITLFLITLMIVSLIGLKTQAKTKLVSPVAKITQDNSPENAKSLSDYITTSQKFLNQARFLANNNPQQTPEQKQEIIDKIRKALEMINQGVRTYPDDDRVYAQRANIYQSMTPFMPEASQFALIDLLEATQINSKNPDYYRRLADLYQQSGDFENAASAYFNAYHLLPTDNQTLYHLAVALEKSGQVDKAIRYYDKLISLLSPDDQDLEVIKKQKANLEKLLLEANLDQLSEPGMEMVPQKPASSSQPVLGTEELPLEEAAIASQLILASPEEKTAGGAATSYLTTNARTGQGVLTAGKTEVVIANQNVSDNRQIIIVPSTSTQNRVLYLAAKQEGWFKVKIDLPLDQNIEFNWWIIGE